MPTFIFNSFVRMKLETILIILIAGAIIYKQMQAYDRLSNEIKLLRLGSASSAATAPAPTPKAATKPPPLTSHPSPEPMALPNKLTEQASSIGAIKDGMLGALTFMMNAVDS
jgi:hypothetical protein